VREKTHVFIWSFVSILALIRMQEGHHPMCENRVYDINLQNIVIDFFFCQIYKELI